MTSNYKRNYRNENKPPTVFDVEGVVQRVYSRYEVVSAGMVGGGTVQRCTAVYSRDCTGWSSQCTPVSDQSNTVQ